jgi:hypothetical protein
MSITSVFDILDKTQFIKTDLLYGKENKQWKKG